MFPVNVLTGSILKWSMLDDILELKVKQGTLSNRELESIRLICSHYLPDFWTGWYGLALNSIPVPTRWETLNQLISKPILLRRTIYKTEKWPQIIWSRYRWGSYELLLGHHIL